MADETCKCGCGGELPAGNKSGFKWGHKTKAAGLDKASVNGNVAADDSPADGVAEEPKIEVHLTRTILDQIWTRLSLKTAAVAVFTALELDSNEADS